MQIGSVMFITSLVKILILEYSFSLPPWIKRTSLSEKEKWNDKALTRFTNKKKQMVILELWLKLFAEHSLTEDMKNLSFLLHSKFSMQKNEVMTGTIQANHKAT